MAYKFQIGAAKLVGAIEVDGLTADSLDAQEGNISNVGALTADSIGKDDGAAQLDLVDDMRAATNKQIQFRAAEQKIFSPNANQLAIEASASVSLDVNGGSKMMINDTAIEFKQRVEMSGSSKLRYGENMDAGKFLVSNGSDYASVALGGDATMVANGALTIAAEAVSYAKIQNVSESQRILGRDSGGAGSVEELNASTLRTMINVEDNADVTDTANVTTAGALMDSEVTNLAQVKAFDETDYATAAQGTKADAALPRAGGAMTGAITTNSTFDGRNVSVDGTKLDGIESGAKDDQTAVEIIALLNSNLDGDFQIGNQADDVLTLAGGLIVVGNLQVDGTVQNRSTTEIQIDDLTLQLAQGAADSATANGAGLKIDGADASLLYSHSGTKWVSNKVLEASSFIGDVAGNASSATVGTTITVANEATDADCSILFSTAASGDLGAKSSSDLTFNSSNGQLTADSFVGNGAGLTGVLVRDEVDSVTGTTNELASKRTILMDAQTGACAVQLPDASATGVSGVIYKIKRLDTSANTCTIALMASGNKLEFVSGGSVLLETQGAALSCISNGTDWFIM